MDYEKLYKETIDKLRKLHNDWDSTQNRAAKEIELVLPELRESEDERIRKELIERFNWELKGAEEQDSAGCSRQKDIAMFKRGIAWLEKQGEQKPADKVEPKFKVGDIVRHKNGDTVIITGINEENHCYYYKAYDGAATVHCDFSFSEECNWELNSALLEKQSEKPTQEVKPFKTEHGKYYYCIKDCFCGGKKQASKGDVVQALRGLPIMGLKDASEYFLPVNNIQKPTWSEEDEKHINLILRALDIQQRWDGATGKKFNPYQGEINWLKSLKPHWKPSEEQIEALAIAVHDAHGRSYYKKLFSIYNDLKTLD